MPRTYTHADAETAHRKVSALLRHHGCVRVHSGVYNDGRTLGIVVADRKNRVSRLYEFGLAGKTDQSPGSQGPDLTDLALLQICNEWETGSPVASAYTAPMTVAGPAAVEVTTREAFLSWLRAAKPGDMSLYFRGELASFRASAPARIVALQAKSDAARPSQPRPAAEGLEIDRLQTALDLLSSIFAMRDAGMISPTQRRNVDGAGMIYYATKRRSE